MKYLHPFLHLILVALLLTAVGLPAWGQAGGDDDAHSGDHLHYNQTVMHGPQGYDLANAGAQLGDIEYHEVGHPVVWYSYVTDLGLAVDQIPIAISDGTDIIPKGTFTAALSADGERYVAVEFSIKAGSTGLAPNGVPNIIMEDALAGSATRYLYRVIQGDQVFDHEPRRVGTEGSWPTSPLALSAGDDSEIRATAWGPIDGTHGFPLFVTFEPGQVPGMPSGNIYMKTDNQPSTPLALWRSAAEMGLAAGIDTIDALSVDALSERVIFSVSDTSSPTTTGGTVLNPAGLYGSFPEAGVGSAPGPSFEWASPQDLGIGGLNSDIGSVKVTDPVILAHAKPEIRAIPAYRPAPWYDYDGLYLQRSNTLAPRDNGGFGGHVFVKRSIDSIITWDATNLNEGLITGATLLAVSRAPSVADYSWLVCGQMDITILTGISLHPSIIDVYSAAPNATSSEPSIMVNSIPANTLAAGDVWTFQVVYEVQPVPGSATLHWRSSNAIAVHGID